MLTILEKFSNGCRNKMRRELGVSAAKLSMYYPLVVAARSLVSTSLGQ